MFLGSSTKTGVAHSPAAPCAENKDAVSGSSRWLDQTDVAWSLALDNGYGVFGGAVDWYWTLVEDLCRLLSFSSYYLIPFHLLCHVFGLVVYDEDQSDVPCWTHLARILRAQATRSQASSRSVYCSRSRRVEQFIAP